MNKPPGILHAFNAAMLLHHKPHDEVRFVHGRYLDIATTKGKDRNSLYFGTSKNSGQLAGIFLGDKELTSKVKDVSVSASGKNITLTVKYIDDNGKLSTIKANIPSMSYIDDISGFSDELEKKIEKIDASVRYIGDQLGSINTRINRQDTSINTLNSSIINLYDQLESGEYRYKIIASEGTENEGKPDIYALYKGGVEDTDSDKIKLYNYVVKELNYDESNNSLIAKSMPKNGTAVDPEYTFNASLNLDDFMEHVANYVNLDSSVGERLTILETTLSWESLFNH